MLTTKKTANKQTSHQKKSDTKEKTSATKTAAVPIANNTGPKDEEQIWFTRLKELLEKIADLERMNKKNEEQIVSLQKENKRLEDKVKDLEGQKTKALDKNNVLMAEKTSLQTVVDGIKQQVGQEVDNHRRNSESLSNTLMQKEAEIIDLKRIKNDLEKHNPLLPKKVNDQKGVIKRLSQVAGSKLTENNPAVAELPDPNRPTQLGERLSELYDNEWNDAMEALGNAGDEKSNIKTLRTIVEKSYEFGKTRAAEFEKGMEQALLNISNSIQVDSTISKFIKAHRKNVSLLVTDALYQAFRGSHTEYNVGGDAVKAFMKKTVALCWLMAIQDPPVVLSTKKSGKLDTNFFRHYTKIGDTVDFVVWPVVYLHEGGPVICKGVAQGK